MKPQRYIYHDDELGIDAYRLKGILQDFPTHIHDFHVIGFIEKGAEKTVCRHRTYLTGSQSIVLFNAGEPHTCNSLDNTPLDYRAITLSRQIMLKYSKDIYPEGIPSAYFTAPVINDQELYQTLSQLFDLIKAGAGTRLQKQELLYQILEQVLEQKENKQKQQAVATDAIATITTYIAAHWTENLSIEELAGLVGCSKSYLSRQFTRKIGISPYRYLLSIRLEHAEKMLQQGCAPVETALQCGFSDQSHFITTFKRFTGFTPRYYTCMFSENGTVAK
ncbi:MAG: AraC family transcriptional regulator [Spirochaetia bacterium]|jgi:AraC-like DNA-binding protein|nr:AraC family transcriptional regulator [Spirochaetia bacterium]